MAYDIIGPNHPCPEKYGGGFHIPGVALVNAKHTTALCCTVCACVLTAVDNGGLLLPRLGFKVPIVLYMQ